MLKDLSIVKKRAGLLERQKMFVEIVDHRVRVSPRHIVDAHEVCEVVVSEFQKGLSPNHLLLADFGADRWLLCHSSHSFGH